VTDTVFESNGPFLQPSPSLSIWHSGLAGVALDTGAGAGAGAEEKAESGAFIMPFELLDLENEGG
jgi:hypothetical protein